VSNQYNISDKIKEANHKLFNSTESIPQRRQSSQRVRFKDNLVEFESEEHDTTTMESSSLRIESVEEEFEEDESIEVENVEEKIEENSSEIDELRGASGSVEIYDENDFEMETQMTSNENGSNGVNGLGDDKTSALKVERPPGRRRSLPPVTRVTPMSESCEELRRLSAKNCCKFKELNEYIEKLPRYNGFNSRYGLSKEDIERRELARLRREQVRNSKHVEQMQQKELVARINEEVCEIDMTTFTFIYEM
jgi:hypothetical protein